MNQQVDDKALAAMARDMARLYADFLERYPDPADATIDGFQKLFDDAQMEYIHYSGGTTPGCPFHPHVVEVALQLAAAYLSFPRAIARPHVRSYGLLLTFFLFSTQPLAVTPPPVPLPTPVRVPTTLLQGFLYDAGGLAPPSPPSTSSSTAASELTDRSLALSATEKQVILTMHKFGGWRVEPDVAVGPAMAALMTAHEVEKTPLLRAVGTSGTTTSAASTGRSPADFTHSQRRPPSSTHTLTSAAAPPVSILLKDATFQKQVQSYEEAKRKLGLN